MTPSALHLTAPITARDLLSPLLRELRLVYLFAGRDMPALVIPGVLMSAAGLLHLHRLGAPLALAQILGTLLLSAVCHLLCLLCFVILNQIIGVAEDRVNAPYRPLPAGEVTPGGAKLRLVACVALTLLLAATHPQAAPSILGFLVATAVNNCSGVDRLPLGKDAMVFVGFALHLTTGWLLAVPTLLGTGALSWVLLLSAAFVLLVPMQDLRDMEGDRLAGRRTLPIVLGSGIRVYLCLMCLLLTLGLALVVRSAGRPSAVPLLVLAPVLLLGATVAVRVLQLRTALQDRRTYVLMTCWLACASSLPLCCG